MSKFLKDLESAADDPLAFVLGKTKKPTTGGPFGDGKNTSVKDFFAQMKQDGIQKTNRFMVVFTVPDKVLKSVGKNGAGISKKLALKCGEFKTGSKTLIVRDSVSNSVPYSVATGGFQYSEISAAFLLGKDHEELKIFNNWMNLAFSNKSGRVGYYKEYVTERLEVYPLDQRDDQNYVYIYEDVFPTSISISDFSNETEGLANITVTFKFRKFLGDNQALAKPPEKEPGPLDRLISGLDKASGAIGKVDNGISKLKSLKNKFR